VLFILLASCAQQLKFDRENWLVRTEQKQYPYRESMLPDLVYNQKLQGKKYNDIIALLGTPEEGLVEKPHELYYLISTGNTTAMAPASSKYLVIYLTPDSIVRDYKIIQ
jgi:hypothetical protein